MSSEERSNLKIRKAKVGHVVGDMLEGNCNNFNHFQLSYFDLK